jgi:antitoxin (DNA-binding transcriptional repressor) of toxin-antitoxin stability system
VKTIKLSEASQALAEYAAGRRDEIVVLTERNKPVAALVPLKPADRESLALSSHPEFLNIIERSRAEFRRGQTLSIEEMKHEFPSRRSPSNRLQTTKAPRRPAARQADGRRLRG